MRMVLKPGCAQMADEARQFAERMGTFRERVEESERRLEEDMRGSVAYGAEPLREDRMRMLQDRRRELRYEEEEFLRLVEKVVRCECKR